MEIQIHQYYTMALNPTMSLTASAPMEEQNHSVTDSEMGNPSILSVLVLFVIHILMYILLWMFLWLNGE